MTIVVEVDWAATIRNTAPLFDKLDRQIGTWFDERRGRRRVTSEDHDLVVLAEQFDKVFTGMGWLLRPPEPAPWRCVAPVLFPAVVALAGTAVAAQRAAPKVGADWTVPPEVRRQFLKMWNEVGDCRTAIAPQVVAAYLGGAWVPPGLRPSPTTWEPAVLLLQAIVHRLVQHGVYKMEQTRLPQWNDLTCEARARWTRASTQRILLWLRGFPTPTDGIDTCAMWDWDERNLFEFLGNAILGPGRAGSTGDGRPYAGAFSKTLFGLWAETMAATVAGTIEVFVCKDCRSLNDYPKCRKHPRTATFATERTGFAAPQDRLDARLAAEGHVKVERRVCQNPPCVVNLRFLVTWQARPLFGKGLDACPHCGEFNVGQRCRTVWTRARNAGGGAGPREDRT